MRILQTLPSLDHNSSGPSYSVPRLCEALQNCGEDTTLFTATAEKKENLTYINHRNFPFNFFARKQLQRSTEMDEAIKKIITQIDVLHCNGMWAMTASRPAKIAQSNGVPVLISPRGALSTFALKQSSLKKCLAWPFMHRKEFLNADCFHATSQKEYEEIRALGFLAPVAIVSNGVSRQEKNASHNKIGTPRVALFLGRLHPIKGIDGLIDAWGSLDKDISKNWTLKIFGPDVSGIRRLLEARANSLGIKNIIFGGELKGEQKFDAYKNANLFILPSKTENFGMAIAEALSCGTPVITTKGAPWAGLTSKKCGWWVERNVLDLKSALESALNMPAEQLTAMGDRGREWMHHEYGWQAIALNFIEIFAWLKSGKKRTLPACVKLD